MDLEMIGTYLSEESYWARGRTLEDIWTSMNNSICFAVLKGNRQIAFARVVTDSIVFGWLMDFFVIESEQGNKVGDFLIRDILEIPELTKVNGIGLRTQNAHGFYKKYGFDKIPTPETWMLKRNK